MFKFIHKKCNISADIYNVSTTRYVIQIHSIMVQNVENLMKIWLGTSVKHAAIYVINTT